MPTTQYYGDPFGAYPTGPGNNPQLDTDIQSLLTPGLVPDIARQSAEVSAGRGVAGSPAGASTAVRMSEQNFQQRLALANQLMSGRTQRAQPYQITPYQSLMAEIAKLNAYRYPPSGGGGGKEPSTPIGQSSASKFMQSPWGAFDTNPVYGSNTPTSSGLWQGQGLTLNDMYDQYGFGNMGSLPGDTTGGQGTALGDLGGSGNDLTNWDWNYQPPEGGGYGDYFGG